MIILEQDSGFFFEDIDPGQDAAAPAGLNRFGELRKFGDGLVVEVAFVHQATFEAAADPGELVRIQGQVLVLGSLGRNRVELFDPGGATEFPPAHPVAAHAFGLVAHADLPQLDTRFELGCQITHQLSKVDSFFGGKVEGDFVAIKLIFAIDQFHHQLMLLHLALAYLQSLLFLIPILLVTTEVLIGGLPQDLANRFPVLYFLRQERADLVHLTQIDSLLRLHNRIVADAKGKLHRIGVEFLSVPLELYLDNVRHHHLRKQARNRRSSTIRINFR